MRPPLVLVSILPIVDRVSERTEATRRHLATLHRTSKVGALVITSRFPLPIDGVAPLTMAVNPLDPASLLHFTTALLRELSFHCHPFRAGCRRLMACQATPCSDCWMVLERLSRTKLSSNGRTLSRVTRRAGGLAVAPMWSAGSLSIEPFGPSRWRLRRTRPLQLCRFNRTDPARAGVPGGRRRSRSEDEGTPGVRDCRTRGRDGDGRIDLRRPRVRARHEDAWRPTGEDYDVSWRMSARIDVR